MIIYVDKTQFLILPALGIVCDAGVVRFTIAFLWYGITFPICRIREND